MSHLDEYMKDAEQHNLGNDIKDYAKGKAKGAAKNAVKKPIKKGINALMEKTGLNAVKAAAKQGAKAALKAAGTAAKAGLKAFFGFLVSNPIGWVIGLILIVVVVGILSSIGSETTLTYLGIINLSELVGTSIGVLMAQGQTSMTTAPHAMFYPALFLSLMLICFNLFGNGLRDAFNPSMRGAED